MAIFLGNKQTNTRIGVDAQKAYHSLRANGFQSYISPNFAIDIPPGFVALKSAGLAPPASAAPKTFPAYSPAARNALRTYNNLGPGKSSALRQGGTTTGRVRGGPIRPRKTGD